MLDRSHVVKKLGGMWRRGERRGEGRRIEGCEDKAEGEEEKEGGGSGLRE